MSISTAGEADSHRAAPLVTVVPIFWIWLPFLVALGALVGSLWLSLGLHLKACPLCFYQRTFMMSVVAVLGTGLLIGQQHRSVLNLLVLPLAVAGLGVAACHVYLEQSGKLECPPGILGIGTAPQQSLVVQTMLLVLLGVAVLRGERTGVFHRTVPLAGVGMGLLLAWGAVASAPPPAPPKDYTTFDTCRPPQHP